MPGSSTLPIAPPPRSSAKTGKFAVVELPALVGSVGLAGTFAGVIGDRMLAGGGANFPDGVMPWNGGKKVWHDTLYALDLAAPGTGWNPIGRLPKPNAYGLSLTAPEGILLIGGSDANGHFRETLLLSLTKDGKPAFANLPALPGCLAQMTGALVGRRIHLCGGIESPASAVAANAHWMLDLDHTERGWQPQPELPAVGRILAMAAALDDDFLVMGGCALLPDAEGNPSRRLLHDAWKFAGGRWSRLADLPYTLAAAGSPAPVTREEIFLVSGDDGSQIGLTSPANHPGFCGKVLCYDKRRNHWSSAGELAVPPPVTLPVTRWRDDYIFFNGEIRPGVRTPGVFAFTPSSRDNS